jgi:hypothetical protein
LVAVLAGLAWGGWCVYDGISASLHAEMGLHATRQTIETVEVYVKNHNGQWPRSWNDLEQSRSAVAEVYRWTGGREHVNEFVFIDFDADANRLAKQTDDEFDAIRPVGPFYGSYRFAIPLLLQTLRQTRHP